MFMSMDPLSMFAFISMRIFCRYIGAHVYAYGRSLFYFVYTHKYVYVYVYVNMYVYWQVYVEYIYMLPPPSVIYLFRGLPGHAGEHVPKTRGHVHFLMRTHVDRIWQCAVRIVFILAVRNIVHVMKRSYP